MSNDKLEPLGLIDNMEDDILGRRIEWMSKKQALSTIILFAVCNIAIILCIIFGPPYFITQSTKFSDSQDRNSPLRFTLDFAGLNCFNDFLTLDAILDRSLYDGIPDDYNITYICHSTKTSAGKIYQNGNAKESIAHVHFPTPESNFSDRIRLIANGVVDYNSLHSLIIFKSSDGFLLPGIFEWSYANPSLGIVQTYIRIMFSIISLFVFIRLLLSDFTLKGSNIAMKLMFILDIILVVACDPLYFLSFFSDSPLFPLFDTMTSSLLVATAFYVALVVLLMRDVATKDVSKCWLLSVYVFFFAAFCIFSAKSVMTVMEVRKNPLSKKTDAIKGLGYTKIGIAAIYVVSLIYAIITFKSDVPNERPMYSFMVTILLITIIISEIYSIDNPYAGTNSSMETFSLLAVGTYIMFFNFINWPTDAANAGDPEAAEPELQKDVIQNVVDDE